MSRPICAAERKPGQRCAGWALPGGAFCWAHEPTREGERAAARSKGGRLRALQQQRPKLNDAAGLLRFNADLINRLLAGELEVDVVRCVVYALSLQKSLIEVGSLEDRLAEVERLLAQRKTG